MEKEERMFYRPQELADICGVNVLTVYRWIKEGKLKAIKLGQWRIPKAEVERIMLKEDKNTGDNTEN